MMPDPLTPDERHALHKWDARPIDPLGLAVLQVEIARLQALVDRLANAYQQYCDQEWGLVDFNQEAMQVAREAAEAAACEAGLEGMGFERVEGKQAVGRFGAPNIPDDTGGLADAYRKDKV